MASVSINILEIVLNACQITLLRKLCGLKGADYDHIILIVTAGNASADGGVHSIVAASADLLDHNTDIILQLIVTELDSFLECGLCGTAAVISPVGKIVDHGKEICLPAGMTEMGPTTKKLYDTLTGIQMGRLEAPEGWIVEIN